VLANPILEAMVPSIATSHEPRVALLRPIQRLCTLACALLLVGSGKGGPRQPQFFGPHPHDPIRHPSIFDGPKRVIVLWER
jgi:hypothetical protein